MTDDFLQEEVRTLYITGLPSDVKPREIRNLFQHIPGKHLPPCFPPISSLIFRVRGSSHQVIKRAHPPDRFRDLLNRRGGEIGETRIYWISNGHGEFRTQTQNRLRKGKPSHFKRFH